MVNGNSSFVYVRPVWCPKMAFKPWKRLDMLKLYLLYENILEVYGMQM